MLEQKMRKAWNKGLTKETDERVKKYSVTIIGRKRTEESKNKQSETRKNLFLEKKIIHPMLNKHHSEEARKKISEFHKGKKHNQGKHWNLSEQSKVNISKGHIGINNWLKGKELSIEHKKKIIEGLIGRPCSNITKNRISKTERENKFVIHHINGNHFDNSPENLIKITRAEHTKLHIFQGGNSNFRNEVEAQKIY